jgi:hypothetical protein
MAWQRVMRRGRGSPCNNSNNKLQQKGNLLAEPRDCLEGGAQPPRGEHRVLGRPVSAQLCRAAPAAAHIPDHDLQSCTGVPGSDASPSFNGFQLFRGL